MWLAGAGASASAGIPTAEDMIWQFKQLLFLSQRRVSPQSVADLSNPAVRSQLQAHIDSSGNLPAPGDPSEYAALFEAAYPAEADRRSYIDARITGAKPSYGHFALATLMLAQRARILWTTNFDTLVADACAKVFDATSALTTVTLDAPSLARTISEGRWPVEVKLHGDFRSRRLKNIRDELREQDSQLRQMLVDSCHRFGLIVVGYSGRDASIMDTIEAALASHAPFPAGLFWLHRDGYPPLPRVTTLLGSAAARGVEAGVVPIENFDESLRDLMRLMTGIDTTAIDKFAASRKRWSPAPKLAGSQGWPVVRLNAIPVVESPTVCRRVTCTIGGAADAREAAEKAGVDILVARRRAAVLAFGSDDDVRRAFTPFGITEFDLHTIDTARLRWDSAERGLLRAALARALARERGLWVRRRRQTDQLAPLDIMDPTWQPLRNLVGIVKGTVKDHPELAWREGITTRLDWADDRLWLLIEPSTVFEGIDDLNKGVAADFARERTVKRYNKRLNDLISFWSDALAGDDGEIRTFGIGDGVDAVFRISSTNAFTRRIQV